MEKDLIFYERELEGAKAVWWWIETIGIGAKPTFILSVGLAIRELELIIEEEYQSFFAR